MFVEIGTLTRGGRQSELAPSHEAILDCIRVDMHHRRSAGSLARPLEPRRRSRKAIDRRSESFATQVLGSDFVAAIVVLRKAMLPANDGLVAVQLGKAQPSRRR